MRRGLVFLLASCAGSKEPDVTSGTDGDADTDADADTDTAELLSVPPPGGGPCRDDEPNDGPDTASPCGTVAVDFGSEGGLYIDPPDFASVDPVDDPVDWYSFETAAGVEELHQVAYWTTGTDVVDFSIWKVTGGGTGIRLVVDYASTDDLLEPPGLDLTDVDPETWYLLEVRAANGGDYLL